MGSLKRNLMTDTATTAAAATPSAADAATAASAAALETAAAEKKVADDATAAAAATKATEDAAAAKAIEDAKTPEQRAADAVTAKLKEVPADGKYELKIAEGKKVEASLIERTTAQARELGLSNETAQKLFDSRVKEHEELVAAIQPGGALWEARDAEWRAAALKDKALSPDGTQASLDTSVEKVQQVLAKFGDDELRGALKVSGQGSHPAVLRFLAKIGRAMGEGEIIAGANTGGERKKTDKEIMYPEMFDSEGKQKAT